MKKMILMGVMGLIGLIGLSSCDTKLCYCYERGYDGKVYRSEIYVDHDIPCNSQSTDTRGCIEKSELGTINPEDIAK